MAEHTHEDDSPDEGSHAIRVRKIMLAAMDRPEDERATFIRTTCGEDETRGPRRGGYNDATMSVDRGVDGAA